MKDKIKSICEETFPIIVSARRNLHRYPELSFEEKFTSNYIFDFLTKCNLNPIVVEDSYSIICDICNDDTIPRILFRADIDALPIDEKTGLVYASINKGVMHACGHDMHTSILLGLATILTQNKNNWKYNVRLLFQSGEEVSPGGAKHVIDNGYINKEDISAAYGFHVTPELKSGVIGLYSGYFMAATDEIHIKITGKGGHAAKPDEFINPILFASKLMLNLTDQQFNTKEKYVLSIGKFIGDGATNVIPDSVFMEGTLRTFEEKDREYLHDIIRKYCNDIKDSKGNVELDIKKGYPSLYNNPDITQKVKQIIISNLGKKAVVSIPQRMTADDFSYISRQVPSCYMRLGCNTSTKQHTSTFNPDESSMLYGLIAAVAITISE